MAAPIIKKRSFLKDLQELCRKIDKSTDGQAVVESMDNWSVCVSLHPKTGLNAHATFHITISCSVEYPALVPNVTFETPIYHPNISNFGGNICLNIFSEWNACYTLLDIVKALLYLIGHPNYELGYDESTFPTKTARLLAGLTVNGQRFAPNASWCEWALANNCLPTEEEENDIYCWTPPKIDVTEALNLENSSPNDNQEPLTIYKPDITTGKSKAQIRVVIANTYYSSIRTMHIDSVKSISVVKSSISSETIPSYVKIRGAINDNASSVSSMYPRIQFNCQRAFQRIILLQPTFGEEEMERKTIFYYAEELGPSYFNLFHGNMLYDDQVDRESRQICKMLEWYPFYPDQCSPYHYELSILRDMRLDKFFMSPKPKEKKFFTEDFSPWAKLDHRGKDEILSGLFFLGERPKNEEITYFLDRDGGSSDGIGGLFNSNGNTSDGFNDTDTINVPDFDFESDMEDGDDRLEIQASSSLVSDKIENENQEDDQVLDEKDISEISYSVTFESDGTEHLTDLLVRRCNICCTYEDNRVYTVNMDLHPEWSWIFRQTRWPFRFTPQQTVELTTEGVNVPPWRVSAGQLLHDVCRVCSNCPEAKNIVLLDPLGLDCSLPVSSLPLSSLLYMCQVTVTVFTHPKSNAKE
ncbi:hypothetical protein ACTXT7_013156 [Hymenolepis weldensis]